MRGLDIKIMVFKIYINC